MNSTTLSLRCISCRDDARSRPKTITARSKVRHLRFNKYRILFTIKDADGDGEDDTAVVLHVRHTAQQWLHLEEKQE